jgi:Kinetochore complex Fta4 of Sim4 subunit, or CENP-50
LTEETLGNPKVDVQPNIVTKTGPIADELRKMRTLLAKVTNHLNSGTIQLETNNPFPEEDMDLEKWDKLHHILAQVNEAGILSEP